MHVMRDVPEHGPTILETRRNAGQGRKTNVGQVGNLRGGWLPPPVHREGGRGRLPIGRRLPTCPTKPRPPTDARSVFHGISRAEGPFKQTKASVPRWGRRFRLPTSSLTTPPAGGCSRLILWRKIPNAYHTGCAGYEAPESGRSCGQAAEDESIGVDPPGVAAT